MSQIDVIEGTQHVHRFDERIWAVDVSAITTAPSTVSGTVTIYDLSAGGGVAPTALVTSGSVRATGTTVVLPTIGSSWIAGHSYRIDYNFADGSGNTLTRSVFVKVDF